MSVERDEIKRKTEANQNLNLGNSATFDEIPPPIFKLNVDCFEELFDRMYLTDLLAFRVTCNRMKQVVDYYIHVNFPAVKFGCGKLRLYSDNLEKHRHIESNSIKLIKEIVLWPLDPMPPQLTEELKEVLHHVENITIRGWRITGDFYDVFLKFCDNMKLLYLCNIQWEFIAGTGNEWLLRQYPKLEHVVLDDRGVGGQGDGSETLELRTFFEQNPNIHILSTTFHYLWENRRCMLGANIKFDRLDIQGDCFLEYGMHRICGLLKELYEHGFYQRLHFNGYYIYSEEDINEILSLCALEKLHLGCIDVEFAMKPLITLKELSFSCGRDLKYIKSLTSDLINVERISIKCASIDDIVPFISESAKVKRIKVDDLESGIYYKNGIVNVSALNEKRKELVGAGIITIFVKETVFLTTKWANAKTNCSLVELKRNQSIEKDFKFF